MPPAFAIAACVRGLSRASWATAAAACTCQRRASTAMSTVGSAPRARRGGIARAGHFAREPMGAVHEKTSFPEETVYLFTSYGPLAMYGPDGEIVRITDAELMHKLLEAQKSQLG